MPESITHAWFEWAWAIFWQGAALLLVVWLIDRLCGRRLWPTVRLAMWLLVSIKLLTPPTLYLPTSLTTAWFAPHGSPLLVDATADTVVRGVGGGYGVIEALYLAGQSASFWLLATWLLGVIAIGAWCIRQARVAARGAVPRIAAPAWVERHVANASTAIGLRKPPRVLISAAEGPLVTGLIHPTIVLPLELVCGRERNPHELDAILLHECAHIRRGDLWIQAIVRLAQLVCWPHPAAHITARKVARLSEVCCDDAAAGALQAGRGAYRLALLDAARRVIPTRSPMLGVGLSARALDLVDRLGELEARPQAQPRIALLTAWFVAFAAAGLVLPMSQPAFEPCRVVDGVATCEFDFVEGAMIALDEHPPP